MTIKNKKRFPERLFRTMYASCNGLSGNIARALPGCQGTGIMSIPGAGKNAGLELVFVKDASGRVTHLILLQGKRETKAIKSE